MVGGWLVGGWWLAGGWLAVERPFASPPAPLLLTQRAGRRAGVAAGRPGWPGPEAAVGTSVGLASLLLERFAIKDDKAR